MAAEDLRRVTRATVRAHKAQRELREAIQRARESGETLRDIAQAAGLSHQRIHQILEEEEKPGLSPMWGILSTFLDGLGL